MAYDEGLAERIRGVLDEQPGVSERRMFGGVAFLVKGHMSVGIVQDKLMVRVGPESYDRVLRERHARRMDFTGKPMKGFVYVVPSGYESDADLQRWVNLGVTYVTSLPYSAANGGPASGPNASSLTNNVTYVTPYNGYRQDNITVVDVRVEKTVKLGDVAKVRLFLDGFNLANKYAAETISFSTGAAFQQPTAILGPRTGRIGFRLIW